MTDRVDEMPNHGLLERAGGPFAEWQDGLIFERKKHKRKGRSAGMEIVSGVERKQRALSRAIERGHGCLGRYLRSALKIGLGAKIGAPPLPRPVIEAAEYREPGLGLEREIGTAWVGKLDADIASRPLFWTLCHIRWIEDGSLGRSGSKLADALSMGGRRTLENRTRNVLRRMGGLATVRGNVSVYSDCTLARAWWRCEFARQVEEATAGSEAAISREEAHEILHENRPAWEELVMLSLYRLTVINEKRARAQIVRHLGGILRDGEGFGKAHVKEAAVRLARHGHRRSLASASWKELDEVVAQTDGRRTERPDRGRWTSVPS